MQNLVFFFIFNKNVFLFICFLTYFIDIQLIYNVVLISAVRQSDSVIFITYIFNTYTDLFFHILFYYGLSPGIEYRSLCYTVGSCLSMCSLSHVRLSATQWTVAHQAPLSMGFSKQESWSGLPFPSLCIVVSLNKTST